MILPVILSGGAGSRLWPMSREALPKQFLPLAAPDSMLLDTILRVKGVPGVGKPTVVCNNEHRFLVAEQLRSLSIEPESIILEPMGRNTAPAVAAAAIWALRKYENPLLLILAADHAINDVPSFHHAIGQAAAAAEGGALVTFGIEPSRPETGYGYIKRGEARAGLENTYAVSSFVEKPSAAVATEYVASGEYLWNSGMFLFSAQSYLAELEKFHPEILEAVQKAIEHSSSDLDFQRLGEAQFEACPSLSIDYAVMEKTDQACVVPVDMAWSDVGSWESLWTFHDKDANGNVVRGEAEFLDVKNCYINTEKQLVAAIGVENLAIVATADAILVAPLARSQEVKNLVERLRAEGRSESEVHTKVYRPWGMFEGVDRGERFQVKRIVVHPGAKTSLQMHYHRSEHWIVVSGTAQVHCDGVDKIVGENESIYIPLGVPHRLHNPGRIPLHLIEVQSGPYCGEDDIVRVEDLYGR